MRITKILALSVLIILAGCSPVQSVMTPSSIVIGSGPSKMVSQQPLQISSGGYVSKLGLGFLWATNNPDRVILSPTVRWMTMFSGENITSLTFVADGEVIATLPLETPARDSSFTVTMAEFNKIVNSREVRMTVAQYNKEIEEASDIGVPNSILNEKVKIFLGKIKSVLDQP